jgi:hypothetical protein
VCEMERSIPELWGEDDYTEATVGNELMPSERLCILYSVQCGLGVGVCEILMISPSVQNYSIVLHVSTI